VIATLARLPRIRWLKSGLASATVFFSAAMGAAPRYALPAEAVDEVIALVDRRLALMPAVAAAKFPQQKPIADPVRERAVIDDASANAAAIQLDPAPVRDFFAAQITIARAVQNHWFERWRSSHEQPPAGDDLTGEIRPQLDAIGREMLSALYLASPALEEMPIADLKRRTARLLQHPGATQELVDQIIGALGSMGITAAPTWESLQRVGVLRIGTTGDYAPFSSDGGGELQGLDIDLANVLAKSWGVTAVFVRTTWPTLMDDLNRRRFDLAISGISITPERDRQADFSAAYLFDGKMPIARREDAGKYDSLEKIDQPSVRIVVNPGGTNERFVREHIKRATILMHPDNRTIFEEIIAGSADLMITDSIEVALQTGRHPELQAMTSEPFNRIGKAILLAHNSELTSRIDAWLTPQIARGEIAARLKVALEKSR
jgi:cyclohexadienyl dehydratase